MTLALKHYLSISHTIHLSACAIAFRKPLPLLAGFRQSLGRTYSTTPPKPVKDSKSTISVPFDPALGHIKFDIDALSPSMLTADDCVELAPGHRIFLGKRNEPDQNPHVVFFEDDNWLPNRKGFFYVHRPQNAPTAASLRFRITRDADPSTFDDGHDLLYQELPWEVPIMYGLRPALYQIVLRDRLVSRHYLGQMRAFASGPLRKGVVFEKKWKLPPRTSPVVYSRCQPFLFNFSQPQNFVWAMVKRKGRHFQLSLLQFDSPSAVLSAEEKERVLASSANALPDNPASPVSLFTGYAIANFDCKQGIVSPLKILKLVNVRPRFELGAEVPLPKEGEILQTYDAQGKLLQTNSHVSLYLPKFPLEPGLAKFLPPEDLEKPTVDIEAGAAGATTVSASSETTAINETGAATAEVEATAEGTQAGDSKAEEASETQATEMQDMETKDAKDN